MYQARPTELSPHWRPRVLSPFIGPGETVPYFARAWCLCVEKVVSSEMGLGALTLRPWCAPREQVMFTSSRCVEPLRLSHVLNDRDKLLFSGALHQHGWAGISSSLRTYLSQKFYLSLAFFLTLSLYYILSFFCSLSLFSFSLSSLSFSHLSLFVFLFCPVSFSFSFSFAFSNSLSPSLAFLSLSR